MSGSASFHNGCYPDQANRAAHPSTQDLGGRSLFQPFYQIQIGQCSTVLVHVGISAGGDQDRANQVHPRCVGWRELFPQKFFFRLKHPA
jgi:hypothetical protein